MPTVDVTLGFEGYGSERISSLNFGANMLFHTDRVSDGSDFHSLVDALGLTSIRYPGGTIAEQFFDLANPNATVAENYFDVLNGSQQIGTRNVLPLSEYLDFVLDVGGTATIVLPTYRYFDESTGEIAAGALEEIAAFVRELLTDGYAPVEDVIFEIGNEWYQERFAWTVYQFGRLQAEIARVISQEADALGVRDSVSVLVQAGRTVEENQILAEQFEGTQANYADGVVTHLYGTNANGNPLGIGGGIEERLTDINSLWSPVLGNDFILAVTEWNVGESGENTTQINGLMRTAPLLRIFSELVTAGVDVAHVWSTQTSGPAGLSDREGEGSDLSPTGYLFDILINGTNGTHLVETGNSFSLRDLSGNAVGYTYTFQGANHTVVYFASGLGSMLELNADLSEYVGEDAFVYATVLTTAPGYSGIEYRSEASVTFQTGLDLSLVTPGSWVFSHELGAYELVQLHISYGVGVNIEADTQNAIGDELTGSAYADTLAGNLGDDTIAGSGGADLLMGGEGHDDMHGGNDDDTLFGGSGNDGLWGDHGRDYLEGGDGNDELHGGNWHDTLMGGAGEDTLLGGDGNDLIKPGAGSGIADGGLGNDILSFADSDRSIGVWGAEQIVEIGADSLSYTGFETVEGSQFDDRFTIVGHEMTFRGLGGADVFDILSGTDNRLEMGGGDDMAFVFYGSGNVIFGGEGDDCFFVTSAGNTLSGDEGGDTFYLFSEGIDVINFALGHGYDTITGFDSDIDKIQFAGLHESDLAVTETANGTHITLPDGSQISLLDVYDFDASGCFLFI